MPRIPTLIVFRTASETLAVRKSMNVAIREISGEAFPDYGGGISVVSTP